MISFKSRDDVLTVLFHLGYLAYDRGRKEAKDRKYPKALEEYEGTLLLVGIAYDKKTKRHSCCIEEF